MKAARISMYGPTLEPVTAVLLADEITVTIEEAMEQQKILPGGYVVCDPFETDGDLLEATLEAMGRQAAVDEYERNAAMLYHYDVAALARCSEGGTVTATLPAPLSAKTIISVFEQLAAHPSYRAQLVVAISEDQEIVTMRNGVARVVRDSADPA